MPRAPRTVQVPGETAPNPDEGVEGAGEDLDLSEASGGDLPAPVDVAALQEQLAKLQAENELFKANVAANPPITDDGKRVRLPAAPIAKAAPQLTAKGWIVPEPAPQPAKA